MTNFHENKLWQEAYVALMDIHGIIDTVDREAHEEVIEGLLEAAQLVAAKIADGLSRQDHRVGKDLLYAAIGLVAITRTQLAVAWGRGILTDSVFRDLDTKYANLTNSLQSFR